MNFSARLEAAQRREQEAKRPFIHFPLGEEALSRLGHILRRKLDREVPLNGEKRLDELGGIHPQKVAVLPLEEPEANVREGLKHASKSASRALGSGGYGAEPPVLPGEKRDDLVGLAQVVGSEDDGFRFAQRHEARAAHRVGAPTTS